jgi:hypothetical protein
MRPSIRITESHQKGWSCVEVDAKHAELLHRELRSLLLRIRDLASADGTKKGAHIFEIQATPRSLEPVIASWVRRVERIATSSP